MISKNNHYEESLVVPFLIRQPGKIKAGATDDLLISVPDLYPTLLGLLGRGDVVPNDRDGVDFSKTLLGEKGPARPTSALYLQGTPNIKTAQRGVRTQRYTLAMKCSTGEKKVTAVVLHDNKLDPDQLVNIAAKRPDLVKTLIETELHPWQKKSGDPVTIDFEKDVKPVLGVTWSKPARKTKPKVKPKA